VVLLSSAIYLSIGQAFAGLVRSADTINALGRFVLIPLAGLGLLSHSSAFGQTFETVARWSPGGIVTTMLATAMQPHTWTGETWWMIVASCGYTVVCAGAGIRWFRWCVV
jgi:ABC-2 type transport system permease protein